MNLITLDLATRIGWTAGAATDPRFVHGMHRLPSTGDDIGMFIYSYDVWLEQMGVDHLPDLVVFEQPILPRETSIATLRKLYGLCSHTEYFCKVNLIKCQEAAIPTVKQFMGVKRTGAAGKQDMIRMCQLLGYQPEDDNAADAIAIRLYTMHILKIPHPSTDLGPLGAAAMR